MMPALVITSTPCRNYQHYHPNARIVVGARLIEEAVVAVLEMVVVVPHTSELKLLRLLALLPRRHYLFHDADDPAFKDDTGAPSIEADFADAAEEECIEPSAVVPSEPVRQTSAAAAAQQQQQQQQQQQ